MSRGLAVLAAALVIGAYAGSLEHPFVFDDREAILANDRLERLWPPGAPPQSPLAGRPVVSLTLSANHALGGLDVRGYRAVNLGIHLSVGLLVFGVARRTLRSPTISRERREEATGLAGAIALLWSVHPLVSECVLYVTQRTESLMALFYLFTLWAAIRSWQEPRIGRWGLAAVAACALGMASKESMVTAPVAVWIHESVYRGMPPGEVLRRRPLFYGLLAASWLALTALVWGGPRSATVGWGSEVGARDYFLAQGDAVLRYLRLAVWPDPLALDYGQPEPVSLAASLPSVLVAAILLVAAVATLALRPRLGFLPAWFFLTLAPTSSFVPITSEVAAERRVYLGLVGLVALVVIAARAAIERLGPERVRRVGTVATLLVALGAAWATARRAHDYRSRVAVWESAIAAVPDNPRAHNNLGAALETAGRLVAARRHYERAIALKPGYADAHYNRANILAAQGLLDSAVDEYRRALDAAPDHLASHANLGDALRRLDRPAEAVDVLTRALRLDPDRLELHESLAAAWLTLGDETRAREHYRQALRIDPQTRLRALFEP